jgi:hypothetical protein
VELQVGPYILQIACVFIFGLYKIGTKIHWIVDFGRHILAWIMDCGLDKEVSCITFTLVGSLWCTPN